MWQLLPQCGSQVFELVDWLINLRTVKPISTVWAKSKGSPRVRSGEGLLPSL